jgi:chromosome segregation ATPase
MEKCDQHDRTLERVGRVETSCQVIEQFKLMQVSQVEDLYDKYNNLTQVNTEIMEKLARIETNQGNYLVKLTDLCKSFGEFKEEITDTIDDINKFKWFRDRVNKWRDNLPGFILWVALGILVLVAISQDLSFSKIAKFFKVG